MEQLINIGLIMIVSSAISLLLFWLRWRSKIIGQDLKELGNVERREQNRLRKLKKRKEGILQKIKARAKNREERDETKSNDLDETRERNQRLEGLLTNRGGQQEEREVDLSLRQEEVRGVKRQVQSQRKRLKQIKRKTKETLEQRAQFSAEEAIEEHVRQITSQVEVEVQQNTQRQLIEAEAYRDSRAQELMSLGRQRYYDPSPAEKLSGYVELPRSKASKELLTHEDSEHLEMLQSVTGVSFVLEPQASRLILRNSPETYTREVARLTYQRWVNGGKLTEEALRTQHKKSLTALERESREAGQTAAHRLGLKDIHPDILHLVGKLLFRTSYTQNQWQHAIEASELCGMMAEELGMNASLARRATLLHDIGKVLWAETEAVGSHAVSGAAFAREHGELPEVIHPIGAHHHDEAPSSALAYLVIAADTLSGARPGARRESSEAFSQHVEQLDELCQGVNGLRQHMIIQGGREVRLQVYPQRYSDIDMAELTEEMAALIEDQCVFPGQIKVTALREVITSAVAHAKRRDQYYAHSSTSKAPTHPKASVKWGGERGSHQGGLYL